MIVLKIIGWILLGILALIVFVLCVRIGFQIEYSDDRTSVVLRWLFLRLDLYPRPKKEGAEKKKKPQKKPEAPPEPAPEAESPPAEEPASEAEAQTALTEAEPPAEETAAEGEAPADGEAPAEGEAPAAAGEAKPAKKGNSLLKTLYESQGFDGLVTIVEKTFSYLKTFMGNLLRAVVVDEFYLKAGITRSDAASTAIFYGEVCAFLFPMLGSLASRCRMKKYDINVYPDYIARFSTASFFLRFHVTPMYLIGVTVAFGAKMLFGVLIGMLVKLFLPKSKQKGTQEKNINSKEKRENK